MSRVSASRGRRADDVFAVVEDQEPAAPGAVLDEEGDGVVLHGGPVSGEQHGLAQSEGVDDRAGHGLGAVERSEFDQPRLVESGGDLLGEAGLA
ncbi:hypothetical protein RKD37_004927 [Streptomyces ambofaciens]